MTVSAANSVRSQLTGRVFAALVVTMTIGVGSVSATPTTVPAGPSAISATPNPLPPAVSRPWVVQQFGAATAAGPQGHAGTLDDFSAGPQHSELRRKGRLFCHTDEDCSKFADKCDKNKGGLSTEPDGTKVCTVYEH